MAYHDFQSKFLCLTAPKSFVRESHCFWENFKFRKVLMMKRGVSRFSAEIFRSHSGEKFRGHPFNVSENLGYRKFYFVIGGVTFFRQKILVWRNQFFSLEKHFGVAQKTFYQKFSCVGGGASRFYRLFLSHRTETKTFVKEPFCFQENFWYLKKTMDKRWHITIFSRIFYVSQCPKIS